MASVGPCGNLTVIKSDEHQTLFVSSLDTIGLREILAVCEKKGRERNREIRQSVLIDR